MTYSAEIIPFERKVKSTDGNGGDGMDLERRVGNLEDGVNQLRIDTTEIKTALKATAQQADLISLKGDVNTSVAELKGELTTFKSEFNAILPTLAKQADLIALKGDVNISIAELKGELTALKTEFKATLPHLVTKTWLAGAVILLVLSQFLVPIIKDSLHLNTEKHTQTQATNIIGS